MENMGNYNFKKDLSEAKATEKSVLERLVQYYGAELKDTNDTNAYDIQVTINGKEYQFEIKEDFMVGDTGNVAVEYSCRGKPSGVETSKADYWIYRLHLKEGIKDVIISLHSLKTAIEQETYFRAVNGGDKGSNSLCYLFKKLPFMALGHTMHDAQPEETK